MDKKRLKDIIKERINATYEEYKRQTDLYEKDKRYVKPDYSWFDTRIKTFKECLELIGMLE